MNPLRGMCQSGARPTVSTLMVSVAIPFVFFFFFKPLQGYQVVHLQCFRPPSKDGGGWEQPCGVNLAEETDSWGQLKSVREQNVKNKSAEVTWLAIVYSCQTKATHLWRAIDKRFNETWNFQKRQQVIALANECPVVWVRLESYHSLKHLTLKTVFC